MPTTLTRAEKITMLNRWRDIMHACEKQYQALYQLLRSAPECPFLAPYGSALEEYRAALAHILEDREGWLEYFAFECRLGEEPRQVILPDGKKVMLGNTADLLMVIEATAMAKGAAA